MKLIFFDVDGTVIEEQTKKMPPSTKRAIEKARKNGHICVINTGGTWKMVNGIITNDTVFDGYVLGCGTMVTYRDRVLFHKIFARELACRIVESLRRNEIDAVLEGGADMVVGDRLSSTYFTENKRPFHNTGNVLVRNLVNRFFHGDIRDIMTGYRAFSRLFVKSFPVLSKGFEIETEMSIHALDKNLRLVSVPVGYRDRPAGSQSKLNTYSDGAKVLMTIFRLVKDYKPLAFFSVVSLVLMAAAAVLFLPVFLEYLDTGLVERFPTLIVAGFLAVGGLLTFCCGLILDTVIKKERQNFELWLNLLRTLEEDEG